MGVIYAIWIDGRPKRYIGSTIAWRRRWSLHRYLLSVGRHHSIYLQRAVFKYGVDQVRIGVLETLVDDTRLVEREQFWMDQYHGLLYNVAPLAGSNIGVRKTPEQKEKSARFHRGRKRSAETRARQSAAMFEWLALHGHPRGTTTNHARDVALATAYYSAASYDAVAPQFGIKGPAAFHAVKRFKERLSANLDTVFPLYIGRVLPLRVHPDWAELAL